METPSWELPKSIGFSVPFCPKHLKFSPLIEREKFRKGIDMNFMKAIKQHINEKVDTHTLYYLKGLNNNLIQYQDNNVIFARNKNQLNLLNSSIPEWEYAVDSSTKVLYHLNESNFPTSTAKEEVVEDDGTVTGCISEEGKSMSPGAYFDGADDYITAGATAADITTGDFTLEAWLKPMDFPDNYARLISKQVADQGYSLYIWGTNNGVYVYLYDTVGNDDDFTSGTILTLDIWQHLALTCDRDGDMIVHKDGVGGTPLAGGMTTVNLTNAGNLEIGTRNAGTTFDYKGNMDEIRISSIVRTVFGGIAPHVVI